MATAATQYDLTVVNATPWAARPAPLLASVRWLRVGRDLCNLAGLLAFALCMVALRLSLYPQSVVSSRTAVLVTLVVGAAGVGAFFAAHRLHEAEHR
jgi:nitric oxide reductase large subunit